MAANVRFANVILHPTAAVIRPGSICKGLAGHCFFCSAPARVKVKHHDYDPIGTWGKYGPKSPQNVKRRVAEHCAMMVV